MIIDGPWALGLGTAHQFCLGPEESHELAPHQSTVHAPVTVAVVEVKRLFAVLKVKHVIHELLQVLHRTVLVFVIWNKFSTTNTKFFRKVSTDLLLFVIVQLNSKHPPAHKRDSFQRNILLRYAVLFMLAVIFDHTIVSCDLQCMIEVSFT